MSMSCSVSFKKMSSPFWSRTLRNARPLDLFRPGTWNARLHANIDSYTSKYCAQESNLVWPVLHCMGVYSFCHYSFKFYQTGEYKKTNEFH